MCLDFKVEIPEEKGRVILKPHANGTTYVHYTYGREYNKEKKYNIPRRTTIGKVDPADPGRMYPSRRIYRHT